MMPVYYCSGASAPADMRGLARIRHPFGVSVPFLSQPALDYLCTLRGVCPVFVDTAAFSEVDRTGAVVAPITDDGWIDRTAIMYRIASALGAGCLLVAPDRVGDQQETLRRLALFSDVMRACAALGARVVVPIQRGGMSAAMFFDACVCLLGCDFVVGIPGNKAAMPPGELEDLLRARRPAAVHLLGVGPRGHRFRPLVDVLRRFVPGCEVSCDSNALAAAVGKSNGADGGPRALTACPSSSRGAPRRWRRAARTRTAVVARPRRSWSGRERPRSCAPSGQSCSSLARLPHTARRGCSKRASALCSRGFSTF